jgi:hypothetical protein
MTRAGALPWPGIGVAALVACVWLNQSIGNAEWEADRQSALSSPTANLVDRVRYTLACLYRRAGDEQLYYESASMILGRPADLEFMRSERGEVPERFVSAFPPADGKWHIPYAEVPLEYPALALPFIVVPRLLVSSLHGFGFVFGSLMGLCLIGAIAVALDAARAAGEDARGLRARAWLASGLLLAQGAMAVQRLDAVTALWIALAVRAAVRRQPLALGAWMGLAAATKMVPALILPALLAADAREWQRERARLRLALGFGATLLAGLAPMFLCSPRALADVIAYHAARGLQCESVLGFVLATIRLVTGTRTSCTLSFGSDNLGGHAADALAAICGPLSVAASLGLAFLAWRAAAKDDRSADHDQGPLRVACAALAALIVLWLTGKVFSPQYMTWGLPVVLAIPGLLGLRLTWLLLAAMAATQCYICGHNELVVEGRALGLLNLGARHAILVVAGYLATRRLIPRSLPAPLGVT